MANDVENVNQEENESPSGQESSSSPISLELLPSIKDSQQHHGLRHGDYQRYRQYCTRRLKRIRNSLGLSLGTRHGFKGKKASSENVSDLRHLLIPLMHAERCWSYAMELKLLANTEPRKKFHMIRKLKKAVTYAEELLRLCETDAVDARSTLEAQAYCCLMNANFKFEIQDWQTAIDLYGKARTIYEKLAGAFSGDIKGLYLTKSEEITPNIRYCAYNLGEGSSDINELMQLRTSAAGQDLLAAKIDAAISQTREKMAATVGEMTWRGKTVPIHNEKARVFLLHIDNKDEELGQHESADEQMAVFDDFMMECKDALQSVKEDINTESGSGKAKAQKNDALISNLKYIQMYLSYWRHILTVERNIAMVNALKPKLPPLVKSAQPSRPVGKASKPEDLIRLFDNSMQSITEICQLPGIEDDTEITGELEAQSKCYKAERCFYVAYSHQLARKWVEAIALYEKTIEYVEQARELLRKAFGSVKERESIQLDSVASDSKRFKCLAHANGILDVSALDGQKENGPSIESKSFTERLDEYSSNPDVVKKPNLVRFPPDYEPVPCKPLFFDLALNHVELPNLDHRTEQKKAAVGITGLVKGWFWGK